MLVQLKCHSHLPWRIKRMYFTVAFNIMSKLVKNATILTIRGSVRGRGRQGKVSLKKVVISKSSWQAAIFKAKGQLHFDGLTVPVWKQSWQLVNMVWNIITIRNIIFTFRKHSLHPSCESLLRLWTRKVWIKSTHFLSVNYLKYFNDRTNSPFDFHSIVT